MGLFLQRPRLIHRLQAVGLSEFVPFGAGVDDFVRFYSRQGLSGPMFLFRLALVVPAELRLDSPRLPEVLVCFAREPGWRAVQALRCQMLCQAYSVS